jgi:alpha-L-fucosidase
MTYGEGPTEMPKAGYFMEDAEVEYTAEDIRFTVKDDYLYAILLGWPGKEVTIQTLKSLYPSEIESVWMLGIDEPLPWTHTGEGLVVGLPDERPCDNAYSLKIVRKPPF